MKKYLFILATVFLLGGNAQANLLINGSFESGDYAGGGFTRLNSGSTAITGWVVGDDGLDWHIIEGDYAHFGKNGVNGSQYAVDLSLDYSPAGSISQTFATTPGQQYKLSFLLGAPWFDAAVNVSIAGVSQQFSLSAQEQYGFPWAEKTLNFTAENSSSTLLFESVHGGFWAPVLDNVNVNPVPVPAALWLLGSGLLGLIGVRRKKIAQ